MTDEGLLDRFFLSLVPVSRFYYLSSVSALLSDKNPIREAALRTVEWETDWFTPIAITWPFLQVSAGSYLISI